MSEKIVEVKNLKFGYDNKLILDNVNFSVDKGDFMGVIGPNGSGKSTLIKLLLKIYTPLEGEIRMFGQNIDSFSKWDSIGYISQKANSFNTSFPATVEEVVGANLFSKVGLFRPLGKQHKEQIDRALEIVGMKDYKRNLIGNLSGGQQQRVFIARVLVGEPQIMFLDEPTVGIDARSEEAVYCLLARLNRDLGITMVMVTHDISAITIHANKIACMGNGNLMVHDTKDGLPQSYIADLYEYGVNLHIHEHNCDEGSRNGVA